MCSLHDEKDPLYVGERTMKRPSLFVVVVVVCMAVMAAALLLCWKAGRLEGFESALSTQGKRILDDVASNACWYEGMNDYTGVLTAPSLVSDMWAAESKLVPVQPGQTRCYVSHHPIYYDPRNPVRSCSVRNDRLFRHDFTGLVADIGMVDLGPAIGRHCAVTFNNGNASQFGNYVSFLELSDPDRKKLADERDKELNVAQGLNSYYIPAARATLQSATDALRALQMEIVALNGEITALQSALSTLDGMEREITEQRIRELNNKVSDKESQLAQIPITITLDGNQSMAWKNDRNMVRLKTGSVVPFNRYRSPEVYNQFKGDRFALFANNNSSLSVRHSGWVLWLHPFVPNNFDFSWFFEPAGDDMVYIRNDYPGEEPGAHYVGYRDSEDRVLIVPPNQKRKWRIMA